MAPGGEMHVPRIAIPANLTYEESGFSLALEGICGALSSPHLVLRWGGLSLALQLGEGRA